jgi:hypothetical protein
MSTRYPLAKMPSQFCPWLEGYQLGAGVLESPKGIEYIFSGEAAAVGGIGQDPANSEEIVQFSQDGVFTARAWNVFSKANGATDTGSIGGGERNFTLGFGSNLIGFQQGQAPHIWDGATLSAMSFTGPTLGNVIGGASYKEQLYAFENDSQSIWFRDSVGTITGAMTEYNTQYISKTHGKVRAVFTFTLSSGLDTQELWATVLDSGEVIIATGTDPADSSWTIVGQLIVGRPIGYNNFIEKDGDVLLITSRGIVSMRQVLFNQDPRAALPMVTEEIEKFWIQMVCDTEEYENAQTYAPESSLAAYIRGVYHQVENRLYVFCPRTLEPYQDASGDFGYQLVDGTMILIYDFNYQGWTVRRFSDVDHVPGSASAQICASYYEPKKGQIYIASNDPATNAVWILAANPRYSDNFNAPTETDTGTTQATVFSSSVFTAPSASDWTDTDNVESSDNSYATVAVASAELYTYRIFGSTLGLALPAAANVVGLSVDIEFKTSVGVALVIYGGYSRLGGVWDSFNVDTTYYGAGLSPTSDTTVNIGYPNSSLGDSLTAAEVNESTFDISCAFYVPPGLTTTVSVDALKGTIYYIESLSENDDDLPLKVISAPIRLTDKNQFITGWKLLQSGDAEAKQALTMQSQSDISARISGTTANGNLAAGVSRDLYNTGASADLVQYILSTQTSKDDNQAHKILSVSPIIEVGGEVG